MMARTRLMYSLTSRHAMVRGSKNLNEYQELTSNPAKLFAKLLNDELNDQELRVYSTEKEKVVAHIKSLTPSERKKVLSVILHPDEPNSLHEYFHVNRGFFAPNINTGTLRELLCCYIGLCRELEDQETLFMLAENYATSLTKNEYTNLLLRGVENNHFDYINRIYDFVVIIENYLQTKNASLTRILNLLQQKNAYGLSIFQILFSDLQSTTASFTAIFSQLLIRFHELTQTTSDPKQSKNDLLTLKYLFNQPLDYRSSRPIKEFTKYCFFLSDDAMAAFIAIKVKINSLDQQPMELVPIYVPREKLSHRFFTEASSTQSLHTSVTETSGQLIQPRVQTHNIDRSPTELSTIQFNELMAQAPDVSKPSEELTPVYHRIRAPSS